MLYLPKDADLSKLFVPGDIYEALVAELFAERTLKETAQGEARQSKQLEAELTQQAQNAEKRANELEEEIHIQDLETQRLQDEVKSLKDQLEEATKPKPVPVPPVVVPPVGTRNDVWPEEPAFDVKRVIGATIENSMTDPSSTQYTAVKRAADALQALGVTTNRLYLGPLEVAAHVDPKANSLGKLGNLVDYIRAKHVHVVADGFDRVMALLKTDDALKVHVKGLQILRFAAVCWNDADKEPAAKLKADVKRLRAAGWDDPILFSLRGNAKLSEYEIEGVFLEIQTFLEDDEFENYFDDYVESDADILCLDLREPQTDKQIKRQFDAVLSDGRQRGYFFYTSKTRDWVATPQNEVEVIRDFTTQLRAIAR